MNVRSICPDAAWNSLGCSDSRKRMQIYLSGRRKEHCLDCPVADLECDHYESDEEQLNLQVHVHVHGSQLLQQLLFQN